MALISFLAAAAATADIWYTGNKKLEWASEKAKRNGGEELGDGREQRRYGIGCNEEMRPCMTYALNWKFDGEYVSDDLKAIRTILCE